jgi:hypothetical protein
MSLDVILALVAAIGQAITGWLGWHVTVDRVRTERKRLYKWVFIGATVVGIIATGLAANRSANLIGQLHAKMHIDRFGFLFPGGQMNSPGIAIGQPLTGLVTATNRGALPVQKLKVGCELTMGPVLAPADEDKLFDKLAIDQRKRLEQLNGNEVLQGDNTQFGCFTKDGIPLTEEQFHRLIIGTDVDGKPLAVYVMILMRYTDKLGETLATENCGHLYIAKPDSPIDCLNHNH